MADKVQNIVINYKVNTAEVEKAKNLSQQAQQATDKFHQSAQQGASKSASETSKLTAEQVRLENAIKNTNRNAFTSYAAYAKQIQNLSRQYSDVKVKIDAATKSINEQKKAQDELNKTTTGMAKNFGLLGNAIVAAVSIAGIRAVVNFTLEMAKLAGNVEGVTKAFEKVPNSKILLDDLRKSTRGTVSDFELMKQALQAKNFGLPIENLGKLLEFATAKAQQTGLSIDYITNSLVTGLGRKSERVFDNLQLDIAELRKRIASGLDFRTAGIQLIIEDLERMGGVIETSAQSVDRLTSSFEALKQEVARQLTQDGGLIEFLDKSVQGLTSILKGPKVAKIELLNSQAIKDVQAFTKGLSDLAEGEKVEAVQQKLNSIVQIIGRYNDEIKKTQAQIELGKGFGFPGFNKENEAGAKRYTELVEQYGKKAKKVFEAEIEDARQRLQGWIDNKRVIQLTIPLLQEYMQSLMAPEVVTQLGLIEAKMDEIKSVSESIEAAKSTQEIHDLSIQLEKLNGELADLKAFGTTKRQLIVNGQLKLVPVIAAKGESGIVKAKSTDMTAQLQELVDNMLVTGVINFKTGKFNIDQPNEPVEIIPMDEWDRIGQEFADNWQGILGQGLADTTDFLGAVIQSEADSYDARLAQSRQYYDKLMVLAGDNEKAKDRLRLREQKEENKLRREAFEADKRAKTATAAINGAAGIVNAFATLPYPAALVASVLIAAQTAAQIAVIQAQKPRFAKGGINIQGPGTKTSDSIDAKLSKGESVMTADETKSSMGILKAVRAKTLNDKVLKDLKISATGVVYAGGMSDERIVSELKDLKNAIPESIERYGRIWTTKKKSDHYKMWVRNKSF